MRKNRSGPFSCGLMLTCALSTAPYPSPSYVAALIDKRPLGSNPRVDSSDTSLLPPPYIAITVEQERMRRGGIRRYAGTLYPPPFYPCSTIAESSTQIAMGEN